MSYTLQSISRLTARNEGKIKSYESCCDIRAWSHDVSAKDRHLREWMKCDMPICVIHVTTLTGFLRTMTCRSRRRVAPRCHPDCKSKVLLESICTSCRAMRDCLKQDDKFEKFFVEEELETSQWPCETCLEALKSIKMFWKIIVSKIFNINISKYYKYETDSSSADSVRSIAKSWQTEMVQQTSLVRNISSHNRVPLKVFSSKTETKEEASQYTIKSCPANDQYHIKHVNSLRHGNVTSRSLESKEDIKHQIKGLREITQNTKRGAKLIDKACGTYFLEDHEEIKAHKKNLQLLQEKCNVHIEEVERLTGENNSLRIELANVYKSCPWRASLLCSDKYNQTLIPKPFECACDDNCQSTVQALDSEMIITMKMCKNENFKHVSLLQVLHKSNEPGIDDNENGPTSKRKDPIEVLTKVHNRFGAIVKREISIVNERRLRLNEQESDVEASFDKVKSSKSVLSCCTLSSKFSSELNYVSTK